MKKNLFLPSPPAPSKRERAAFKSGAARVRAVRESVSASSSELVKFKRQSENLEREIVELEASADAADAARLPGLREQLGFTARQLATLEARLDPQLEEIREPLNQLGQEFSKAMGRWFATVENDWSAALTPLCHGDADEAKGRVKLFPVHRSLSIAAIVNPRSWGNGSGLALEADYALSLIAAVLNGKNPWAGLFTNPRPVAR